LDSATQAQAVPFLICDMRVVPPKQASAGSTELVSQIAKRRTPHLVPLREQ
jgi:hypothetical protein